MITQYTIILPLLWNIRIVFFANRAGTHSKGGSDETSRTFNYGCSNNPYREWFKKSQRYDSILISKS